MIEVSRLDEDAEREETLPLEQINYEERKKNWLVKVKFTVN